MNISANTSVKIKKRENSSDFPKAALAEHPIHELIHPSESIDDIDIGKTASHERNI